MNIIFPTSVCNHKFHFTQKLNPAMVELGSLCELNFIYTPNVIT